MRIVFMGTGEIGLPSLRWLLEESGEPVVAVFTQPDRPVGRKQVLTEPEVKRIATEAGIPVHQPERLRGDEDALERLRACQPDLIVVMAYGQILPAAVLDAPRQACVNLHASLLPRHRGASPIQAAIREGDEESGLTLMHVVPKLDAGDRILEERLRLAPDETGGSLHDRLADLGPPLLARGLPLLASGEAPRQPQEEGKVTYAGKLGRDDGVIDWTRPPEELERLIRAYDPWPGTYTWLPGRHGDGKKPESGAARLTKLKLFPGAEAHPTVSDGEALAPGEVRPQGGSLWIGAGNGGALCLPADTPIQPEGRKRMSVEALLAGGWLAAGQQLEGGGPQAHGSQ